MFVSFIFFSLSCSWWLPWWENGNSVELQILSYRSLKWLIFIHGKVKTTATGMVFCCSDLLHVIAVNLQKPNLDSFILNMNSLLVSIWAPNLLLSMVPSLHLSHPYLDLSFNYFIKLPSMFSSLTKLTYLNLSNAIRTPLQPKLQTHFPKMVRLFLFLEDIRCDVCLV